MQSTIILHQLIQLFILIALGYFLRKIGMMNDQFNKQLTNLLLNVTLPATIIDSVLAENGEKDMNALGEAFLISIVISIVLPLIGMAYVRLARLPEKDRGMYVFMTAYSNVGFMGLPVMNALYGSTGVFYTAIFNIIFNLSVYTFGVACMLVSPEADEDGTAAASDGSGINADAPAVAHKAGGRMEAVKTMIRSIMSPGVIFSILAIVIYIFSIRLPDDLAEVMSLTGSVTTPAAMLLIGSSLARIDIREVFNDWHVYLFVIFKIVAVPLAAWPLMHMLLGSGILFNVFFVLIMLPVANNSVLFATQYGRDETLAAKAVFISTAASIVTIPALLSLF